MIRKLLKNRQLPDESVKELESVYAEIESRRKKITHEKNKIQEEHVDGSRLTKHRFTI